MPNFCSRVLGSSVGQCPEKTDLFLIKKWKDFVVQKITSRDSCFVWVKLCKADIRKGVDTGLLIYLTHPFDVTNVISVLPEQKPRVEGFDLTVSLLLFLCRLGCYNL